MKIIITLLLSLFLVGCFAPKPKFVIAHCTNEPVPPIIKNTIECGYYVKDGIRKAGCIMEAEDFVAMGKYFQQLETYYDSKCVKIVEVK